jgi:long-chain fatty acid transport protein
LQLQINSFEVQETFMQFKTTLLRAGILASIAALTNGAQAGGFALAEQSIAAMGMANAGASAQAMGDASTIFYNPAGMSSLSSINVAQGLHVITLSAKFKDGGSVAGVGQSPTNNAAPGSVGAPTPVPTFFAAMPLNNQFAIGLGISAPFGLKTEYNEGWIGRYQALVSDVKTINLNPSVSFKVNDQFSIGAGFNFMKFQAELTNNVNYTAVALRGLSSSVPAATLAALAPALAGREGAVQIKGSDTGYGYNVGAIFNVSPDTRVGLGYRSSIKFSLAGDARFTRPDVAGLPASISSTVNLIQNVGTPDGPVTVDIKTPSTISLSAVSKVSPRLTVAGDVTWTEWSTIPELKIVRSNGSVLNRVDYSWADGMRYSVGVSYDYGNGITARAGLAYDESPVQNELRTARLPDNNRTWISTGGSYQYSPKYRFDGALTYIMVKNGEINDNNAASGAGIIKGTYKGNVIILSLGLVGKF